LSDQYTWLTAESDPSFRRADGKPNRPLPFDEALKMKPSYEAILKAFQNAPTRPRFSGG
jgi:endo-1,4-beta-xylanase